MPSRWVPNSEGEMALLLGLADGANAFAEFVVDRVKQVEGGLERYHFQSDTHPRTYLYRDTIRQATYLNGELIGGTDVVGGPEARRGAILHSRVYTASIRGHMLEITGAAPHRIRTAAEAAAGVPKELGSIRHPGFNRRPHFVPGLFMAVSEVGAKMRGHVKIGALRPPPAKLPVGGL